MTGVEHTLATRVQCTGIGLHSGRPVDSCCRRPRPDGDLFVRSDLGGEVRFPARAEWVVDTTLATTLGNGGERLSTVEHLTRRCTRWRIDNCTVEVSGPEVPVMDGSASAFVYLIQQAGLRPQRRMRRRLVIRKPIEVREGKRSVRVLPSREFKLTASIDYPHPAIGRQSLGLTPEPRALRARHRAGAHLRLPEGRADAAGRGSRHSAARCRTRIVLDEPACSTRGPALPATSSRATRCST